MEENKLADQIHPLEAFAAKRPGVYRFRVMLVAGLGYVYLLGIVVILLSLVGGTIYYAFSAGTINWLVIKVIGIPLVLAGLVLKSLWITIPEPDGKALQPEQAQPLFEMMNEVSKALNGPKVHHVLISDEFNAGIVQIPQLGMFGWLRNYLVVGLPLLRALSPAEFRSVIAHEFGHLSGKHGRFSGWIYRVRQSWIQILTTVKQERSYASFLFEPFLKWYAPYLNVYSFVLARAQEREADSYSVDLAGKEVAALMLVRMMAKERELAEDFWPNFFRQSKQQGQPPKDPFVQMLGGLDHSIGHTKAQKWFLQALREPTGYDDTHPALADRLAAIGFAKDGPETMSLLDTLVKTDEKKETAAEYYVQELPDDFLAGVNRLWRERIAKSWREYHEQIKQSQKRLNELDEHAKTQALTLEEQWERVSLLNDVQDRAATLPGIHAILTEAPDHLGANFALGAILLEEQDAEGIKFLELAMQLSSAVTGDACELISGFYLEQGERELSERYRVKADQYYEKVRRQEEEAMHFSNNDRFEPHELNEDVVSEIKEQLTNVRGLSAAYLVRKIIDGDESLYVLGVVSDFTWRDGRSGRHTGPLMDELVNKVRIPTPFTCLPLEGEFSFLLDKVHRINGALLYSTSDYGLTYRN